MGYKAASTLSNIATHDQFADTAKPNEDKEVFDWLKKKHEFTHNPFESTNLEGDSFLQRHFLKLPIFDFCLKLAHTVIIAVTGAGKSALAWAISQHFASTFPSRRVIAATHTVRQKANQPATLNLSDYLKQLLETLVRQSFVILAQHGRDLPQLSTNPRLAAAFADWFDEYNGYEAWREDLQVASDTKSLKQVLVSLGLKFDSDAPPAAQGTVDSQWLREWLSLLGDPIESPDARHRWSTYAEPLARFQAFVALLIEAGVREVILLVDGFDPEGKDNPPETIRKFVRPLLALLTDKYQIPHLHLKLFLPDDIGKLEELALPKRTEAQSLKWERKQLAELLKARLSYASDGVVKSLNQLLEDDTRNFDDLLLKGGYMGHNYKVNRPRSPRELLQGARDLIVAHGLHKDRKPATVHALSKDFYFDMQTRRWVQRAESSRVLV